MDHKGHYQDYNIINYRNNNNEETIMTKEHGCPPNDGSSQRCSFLYFAEKNWFLEAAGGCPTSLRHGRWLDLTTLFQTFFQVHFVEMDPWVVSDILRPNLEWTGFLDNSYTHSSCGDFLLAH
uniref:Uncharacterized protein n=1 Tax=Lactuca sativa TaxID=4236 RepID=A0A9R1V090_LACSA|nr:hypothetical protein LSAT_V11C700356070 [Lactuca sativa]